MAKKVKATKKNSKVATKEKVDYGKGRATGVLSVAASMGRSIKRARSTVNAYSDDAWDPRIVTGKPKG